MISTTPAPAAESSHGPFVPGTIGFDLYLAALHVPPSALRPASAPSRFELLVARIEADLADFRRMHHEDGTPRLDERALSELEP